jgi:hypothetical protein
LFVEAADTNGIQKGAALHVLRCFLDSPAREEFTAFRAQTFPAAVDWLLSTFAPASSLAIEYKSICSMTQSQHESPREFSLRLRQRASRLGPLMDEVAVTILMEGLDPSIAGFVQSALRHQKPTFTSIMQEAELVHTSVRAAERKAAEQGAPEASRNPRPTLLLNPARGRAESQQNSRQGRGYPVLATDYSIPDAPASFSASGDHPAMIESPAIDVTDVFQNVDEALVAHLATPQRIRYCYTCWRPGHFSSECPLIPESERAGIAQRRAEVLKRRGRYPQSAASMQAARSYAPYPNSATASPAVAGTSPENFIRAPDAPENGAPTENPARLGGTA